MKVSAQPAVITIHLSLNEAHDVMARFDVGTTIRVEIERMIEKAEGPYLDREPEWVTTDGPEFSPYTLDTPERGNERGGSDQVPF